MIIVNNIKLQIDKTQEDAFAVALKKLRLPLSEIRDISLHKVSIDARKGDVKFVYSVAVSLKDQEKETDFLSAGDGISVKKEQNLVFTQGEQPIENPPVICGFGPAGMFCALILAQMGFRPIVIEQGCEIDKRVQAVTAFETKGILDVKSNIQFGEGGAGTFSDGKLTTRIGDDRCGFVTKTLVRHGAPGEISYKAKPHIGTDLLVDVMKSIRQEIIALGGTIYFETTLTDIQTKNGAVAAVITSKGTIETQHLIMATGHSARDVFFMLKEKQADLQPKPFSVGVRIEHLQSEIDKSLYHDLAQNPILPQGEYQLSCTAAGRGVYTFCMCPGGKVVAAASEENTVVVNGMSNHARNGKNANSAMVVSVLPEDFEHRFEKAIAFQRQLEQAAFKMGGSNYHAPVQTVGRFLQGKPGADFKRVNPTYPIGTTPVDFNQLLPNHINQSLRQALPLFDRKIRGFAAQDTVMTGVETRTSSPVRIVRNEAYQSNIQGLYPCGEGAGYAGGIMSAAVDGIRVAQYITQTYKPNF